MNLIFAYFMFQLKYKEVYEHIKDKGYNFGPKAVPFVNIRKVNKVLNEVMHSFYTAGFYSNGAIKVVLFCSIH